ncbi:MAG: hypothetical protein ACOH2R_25880 [Pseudomonas sp.]
MNPLTVLQDSLYFFRRNLSSILMLCLPLVVLEAFSKQLVSNVLGDNASPAYELLVGLFFYPLYTAALILFLDARTRSEQPRKRDLMAMALRLWPTFAVLSALSTLLIMLGMSMFVIPGIYVMIKLVFSEYLLVLEGMTPLTAMRESFKMSQGHFLRIMVCVLCVYLPLSVLEGVSLYILPNPLSMPLSLAVDSASSFLQLFTSVVMFRLFMLINPPAAKA